MTKLKEIKNEFNEIPFADGTKIKSIVEKTNVDEVVNLIHIGHIMGYQAAAEIFIDDEEILEDHLSDKTGDLFDTREYIKDYVLWRCKVSD